VPNKIRNVVVSDITFDTDGDIKNFDFYEAKIESKYRLTYAEVEEAILRKKKIGSTSVNESINALKELTITLLGKRAKRNALEIESSEPILKINNIGAVEAINLSTRMFAHQMIEEAMIAANICAITFVKSSIGISINRFHDKPDTDKLLALFEKFQSLGLKKSDDPIILLQRCIEIAKRNENAASLQSLILQGLPRAIYSSKKSGHFGLQLEEYSHFTSPIRRYPDLIIHRLIKSILKKEKVNFDEELFEEECNELSNLEKRAEKSSRQVTQQLICFFLKNKVGNILPARVVGVTHFGVFCELQGFFVSGLIHVSDLKDDHYVYSERNNILKGRRSGRAFKIGDQFNVRIDAVIPEEGKIILSKNK
jgi:ribonuclease R